MMRRRDAPPRIQKRQMVEKTHPERSSYHNLNAGLPYENLLNYRTLFSDVSSTRRWGFACSVLPVSIMTFHSSSSENSFVEA
mmetsp:Transcript_20819/g.48061  ORF Transcript_20819/g.48061 Transcript_20819/m.48061 type:complete len:82 (-) Transcript_20819:205-450(-)